MTREESILVIVLVYGSMIIFTGISYALMITYLILRKFNDFGDTSCKLSEYSPRGIGYTRMVDDVPAIEKNFLFSEYGEDPYIVKHSGIPEILLKNSEKNSEKEY